MAAAGDRKINKRTGQTAVFNGQTWVLADDAPRTAGADLRGRLNVGLGPLVQAEQTMSAVEGQGNPYSLAQNPDNAAAKFVGEIGIKGWHPLGGVAKMIGGEDYQRYDQAGKAFEAQLMPIMSGAAVSPSEAERQIKSALPELGDSPATLREKARTRRMMLNGAAMSVKAPMPYPDVPTYGVNTDKVPAGRPAQPSAKAAGAQPSQPFKASNGYLVSE